MVDYQAQIEAYKVAVKAVLPGLLLSKSLADFDDYIADTPRRPDIKQLGFFIGMVEDSLERTEFELLVHATLPGIEQPTQYLGPIVSALKSMKASLLGMSTLEGISSMSIYAGEIPEGGDGSFIQFSLLYSKDLDDCD
jgi:hypothetical protein